MGKIVNSFNANMKPTVSANLEILKTEEYCVVILSYELLMLVIFVFICEKLILVLGKFSRADFRQ